MVALKNQGLNNLSNVNYFKKHQKFLFLQILMLLPTFPYPTAINTIKILDFVIHYTIFQQIEYADMLKRVEPLRNELKALEDRAQSNVTAGDEVRELIAQLEKSIASYKEEYAQLISQAQAIKTDLENVQAKVTFVKSIMIYNSWRNRSQIFVRNFDILKPDWLGGGA